MISLENIFQKIKNLTETVTLIKAVSLYLKTFRVEIKIYTSLNKFLLLVFISAISLLLWLTAPYVQLSMSLCIAPPLNPGTICLILYGVFSYRFLSRLEFFPQ